MPSKIQFSAGKQGSYDLTWKDGPQKFDHDTMLIQPRKVFPIHYNTWPLLNQDAAAWASRIHRETLTEPIVHPPGVWFEV